MTKICQNCGTQMNDNDNFCNNCGSNYTENVKPEQTSEPANTNMGGAPKLQKREIPIAIILTIITCGIYGIYWFITMTDDANKVSGENDTSGAVAFLLSLVTCGIYGIYWYWKMGQKLYTAGQKNGVQIQDNSILYLILGIVGFGIISECLIQNDLNKFTA